MSKCGHCGATIKYGDFFEVVKGKEVPRPDFGKCEKCGIIIFKK